MSLSYPRLTPYNTKSRSLSVLQPGRKDCPKYPGTECRCDQTKSPSLASVTGGRYSEEEDDIQRERGFNKRWLQTIAPWTGPRLMRETVPGQGLVAPSPGGDSSGFLPLLYAQPQ